MPLTLYDKLWKSHEVKKRDDGMTMLYIDRCFIHEISSPVAFETMRNNNYEFWRPETIFGVADHQVPTQNQTVGISGIKDSFSKLQVKTLEDNCDGVGATAFKLSDKRHGIVHVIGPEQGISLPGTTIVCGDSHTSTHGALAALAQGIGTTELEHVFTTQTLLQHKCKNMKVEVNGDLPIGVTSKDLALHIIAELSTAGGTGYAIEYMGSTIEQLSMESRFTLCNMTIEAGARTGIVAFDKVTEAYIKGRPYAPTGAQWEQALEYWNTLHSDEGAHFDKAIIIDAQSISPHITWGTKPDQVTTAGGLIPELTAAKNDSERAEWEQAYHYMGVTPGEKMSDLKIDQVFIGSCTNSRLEDLRAAAEVVKGKHVADTVKRAMIVPGSGLVKEQAEREQLDKIFIDAGFEWREPGCSMCNAMNPDKLEAGERCASTSNRNFEGRQGYRGRTHLVSPPMAAGAAIAGHFVDIRDT